jgi:hypothetical protein
MCVVTTRVAAIGTSSNALCNACGADADVLNGVCFLSSLGGGSLMYFATRLSNRSNRTVSAANEDCMAHAYFNIYVPLMIMVDTCVEGRKEGCHITKGTRAVQSAFTVS